MASNLQKVMQRVRLVAPSGEIFKPSNRVLCALDAIAAHTHHDAPERGACKAASIFGERGFNKSERTFFRAANDAEACGLLGRYAPAGSAGVPYKAQIYLLHPRLVEASETGFKGDLLFFNSPDEPPGKPGDPPEIKSLKAKAQHAKTRLAKGLAKQLISKVSTVKRNKTVKNLNHKNSYPQECQFGTLEVHVPAPAPAPDVPVVGVSGSGCSAVSACLPTAGGGGAGESVCSDGFNSGRPNFVDELESFLTIFGESRVEIDFQIRRKTDGNRGGRLWRKVGGKSADPFCSATQAAARVIEMQRWLETARNKTGLEGILHALGDHPVLMLDDLDHAKVKEVADWWHGAMMVIETSPGNFQAFLRAHRALNKDARKTCQRALAAQFECDDDATGGVQMHRYPGSMNYKNGGAFCTKLTLMREPIGCDVDTQIDVLLSTTVLAVQRAKAASVPHAGQQPRQHGSVDSDPSSAAFIFAIKGLKACIAPDTLASQIAATFNPSGKHTRDRDGGLAWAKRTIENAGVKALGRARGWYLNRATA